MSITQKGSALLSQARSRTGATAAAKLSCLLGACNGGLGFRVNEGSETPLHRKVLSVYFWRT